jgi:hypothetical protein
MSGPIMLDAGKKLDEAPYSAKKERKGNYIPFPSPSFTSIVFLFRFQESRSI